MIPLYVDNIKTYISSNNDNIQINITGVVREQNSRATRRMTLNDLRGFIDDVIYKDYDFRY